jgi:hypothetical protein
MIYKILNIVFPFLLGICYLWFNKNKKTIPLLLALFFLYTAVGELSGLILVTLGKQATNIPFYDKFFIPTLYLFQFGIFYIGQRKKMHRWIVVALSLIYLFSFLFEKFSMQYERSEFSYYSYCIGSICVIMMSLLYLYTLVRSAAILHFKSDPLFWFSAGSLFFQVLTFPLYALLDFWRHYKSIGNAYNSFSIFCIYISYLFYASALLWMKRK